MKIRFINIWLFFILIIPGNYLSAQQGAYSWNDLVAWNGVTHWTKYMIISPEYFGPNALPVPELKQGIISPKPFFDINAASHISKGDKTSNLFLKYYHPFNQRIAIEISLVPIEFYKISSEIRDKRKIRNEDPKGFAIGDLMFGTIIQLIKGKTSMPDITFGAYFRTASGGKMNDARYTDMPGYNFDFTFGKDVSLFSQKEINMRWFVSAGFYVWQTNLDNYLQNDAFSAGAGLKLNVNQVEIITDCSGYFGYISHKNEPVVFKSEKPYLYDGDKPVIYKFKFITGSENLKYNLVFQQGLHDFDYSSIIFGISYFPNY